MIQGIKFYLPLLALMLIAVFFSEYVAFLDNPECTFLFGVNVSVLGLLVFCFLLPGTFAVGSLYLLSFSLKTRGRDHYPPSNIPWIGAFKKRSGVQAKIPKALGYVFPVVSVWMVWLGVSAYIEIADGRTLSEIGAAVASTCELP